MTPPASLDLSVPQRLTQSWTALERVSPIEHTSGTCQRSHPATLHDRQTLPVFRRIAVKDLPSIIAGPERRAQNQFSSGTIMRGVPTLPRFSHSRTPRGNCLQCIATQSESKL